MYGSNSTIQLKCICSTSLSPTRRRPANGARAAWCHFANAESKAPAFAGDKEGVEVAGVKAGKLVAIGVVAGDALAKTLGGAEAEPLLELVVELLEAVEVAGVVAGTGSGPATGGL
jgi:hypothetical protein